MMSKKQSDHYGLLNIGEKYVTIDTEINFQMLVIKYIGHMKIYSTLPNNYVVKNGRSAIIIIKKDNNQKIEDRLFRYVGNAKIISCKIHYGFNVNNIYINRVAQQTYDAFGKTIVIDGDDILQTWDGLETNWEDLSFDGNNDKINYLHIFSSFNEETRSITLIKEIRSGIKERKKYG